MNPVRVSDSISCAMNPPSGPIASVIGPPVSRGSEAAAVHRLPDTSAEERAAIEAGWRREVAVAFHAGRPERRRDVGVGRGVPGWFFDRHAPGIYAQLEAKREAFRREMRGLAPARRDGGGHGR